MNAAELLKKFMRKGWQTSEFGVAVLGVIVPQIITRADEVVGSAGQALASSGTWGQIAAAGVAAAYAVGRSIVKAQGLKALLTPVAPPVNSSEFR